MAAMAGTVLAGLFCPKFLTTVFHFCFRNLLNFESFFCIEKLWFGIHPMKVVFSICFGILCILLSQAFLFPPCTVPSPRGKVREHWEVSSSY